MRRTEPSGLVTEGNLFDFFHERIESAVQHQRAPVSENAVFYLSSLLTEQARRGEADGEDSPTLVELRHRAVTAPLAAEAVGWWLKAGAQGLVDAQVP
jgi:hypothetical protein